MVGAPPRHATSPSPPGDPQEAAPPGGADPVALLGPLVREHRTRWSYVLAVVTLALVLGGMGVLGAVRFAERASEDPSRDTWILGLLTTAPFLLGAALAGVWAARRIHKVVRLHHGGLHHRDAKGERAVPWRSVDGVYQRIVRVHRAGEDVDVRDEYTIALRDGTALEIDYHFDEVEAFGSAVTAAVTELLLPVHRDALRAGETLDFGPIRLDAGGVHTGDRRLPWDEVESISWKAGILASDTAFLMVRRRGGLLAWAKVPVEQIKNYPVLMAIAADMGKAD